jgi:Uma2 family endonuclease
MSTHATTSTPGSEVYYPDSDGEPMAESDEARDLMIECIAALEDHFADEPDVYVSGNLLLYYEQGNPRRSIAPDVLVTRGIGKHRRRIYQMWVEGKAPDFVLEISSDSTWSRDLLYKGTLYFNLGVQEYFLFDSSGQRLPTGPILGWTRGGLTFEQLEPNERGRVLSESLGLELAEEAGHLRFYDPRTGRRVPTRAERAIEAESKAAEAESKAAEAESKAAEAESRAERELGARREAERRAAEAEAEARRLAAELARLRGERR